MTGMTTQIGLAALVLLLPTLDPRSAALAFEGQISATLARGGESQSFLYTAATTRLRVENTATDRPHPWNVLNRQTGELILCFPHNRTFVRLKPPAKDESTATAGFPATPVMPQSGGVQLPVPAMSSLPVNLGPTNLAGVPPMPPMPRMPQMPAAAGTPAALLAGPMMMPPPMQQLNLTASGDHTNWLGLACQKYELKQGGEVMEIWATDQLPAFQPYLPSQPPRIGPRAIEDQWGLWLKARKLFPLLAVLRSEGRSPAAAGSAAAQARERLRFEVRSIIPAATGDDSVFQPPPDYREIQPTPF
jgi:hypothetical protein